MDSVAKLEKLVITKRLPDPPQEGATVRDWERVWRLSTAEIFLYAESARAVCRELGLRPLKTALEVRARN